MRWQLNVIKFAEEADSLLAYSKVAVHKMMFILLMVLFYGGQSIRLTFTSEPTLQDLKWNETEWDSFIRRMGKPFLQLLERTEQERQLCIFRLLVTLDYI